MSVPLWRKIAAAPILILAVILFLQESAHYLLPKPVHHIEQIGSTTIEYHITDTVITPGECADFTWELEGIQAVYLADVGTVGQGKQTVCAGPVPENHPLKLRVIDQSGGEHIYDEAIQVHPFNPAQPAILLLVIGLLIAAAPLPQLTPKSVMRLTPLLIIPLGFVGSYGVLLIVDQILTLPITLNFVTRATNSVFETDPDRCGLDQVASGAAPFKTHAERVLFKDIPEVRAGEGRIIVTGVSNANESFIWHDLSPDLQNKLLNLTIAASSNLEQGALIDILQREKQTLTPTTGKSVVVLLYWNAVFAAHPYHKDYEEAFVKYDQFNLDTSSPTQWRLIPTYDPTSSIQLAYERSTAMLFHHLPRALEITFQPVLDKFDKTGICYPAGHTHKDVFLRRDNFWASYLGTPDEYILPNASTQSLETMADYIQSTGTPMILIHLPVSHWFRDMVHQERYLAYMETFAEKYNVPTYDLSELLSDDDFRDNIHLTITGRKKLQVQLFDILVQEGVLSEDEIPQ